MPVGNNNNLIPLNERTKEEQTKITTMGGKASGKARRRKRDLKELLELALSQPWEENTDEDNYTGITVALIKKAANGDVQAYTQIAKMLGQQPKDEVEVSTQGSINITIGDDE